VGVVIGHRNEMYGNLMVYREWGIHATIMLPVESAPRSTLIREDIPLIENTACLVGLNLMGRILDRPTEYQLSRGIRSNYERMHNLPAVVTISLSQPVVHTISGPTLGGGWKNPEHDVRGHERHYKSGKVVWVAGHKRGDPNVQRRTIYRVIP
jgi:hypothetical protein